MLLTQVSLGWQTDLFFICPQANLYSFLGAFFPHTVQVTFGTTDGNVTAGQLFPLSSVMIVGLCSVPYYSRNLQLYVPL